MLAARLVFGADPRGDFDFDLAISFFRKFGLLLAGGRGPSKRPWDKMAANGPFLRANHRCNWAGGRYSPRENRAPTGAGKPRKEHASMFITPAFAQGSLFGGAGGEGGMLVSLLPFALIFVIMYFLILRPQQKRVKQHQEMVKNVRRGDTVITNGGLIGKVTKVIDDDQIEIEIADDVRIRQMRQMVTDVRAKGEPVKEEAAAS
jgi:preprotein translocase subunit YajC